MTPDAILAALGIYAGTFVVAAISSVVPLVSIDVFLVGVALAVSPATALVAGVLAAAGQVVGKLPIYYATRGAGSVAGTRIARLRSWLARWQRCPHVVLATSAVFGLPPFSIVASAAGALAIRVAAFCLVVFVGRALRFACLVAIATHATR